MHRAALVKVSMSMFCSKFRFKMSKNSNFEQNEFSNFVRLKVKSCEFSLPLSHRPSHPHTLTHTHAHPPTHPHTPSHTHTESVIMLQQSSLSLSLTQAQCVSLIQAKTTLTHSLTLSLSLSKFKLFQIIPLLNCSFILSNSEANRIWGKSYGSGLRIDQLCLFCLKMKWSREICTQVWIRESRSKNVKLDQQFAVGILPDQLI